MKETVTEWDVMGFGKMLSVILLPSAQQLEGFCAQAPTPFPIPYLFRSKTHTWRSFSISISQVYWLSEWVTVPVYLLRLIIETPFLLAKFEHLMHQLSWYLGRSSFHIFLGSTDWVSATVSTWFSFYDSRKWTFWAVSFFFVLVIFSFLIRRLAGQCTNCYFVKRLPCEYKELNKKYKIICNFIEGYYVVCMQWCRKMVIS